VQGGARSESSVGATVQTWSSIAPPRLGAWARLSSTDLSVWIMGLGHSDGAATYGGGRSSMRDVGPLGTLGPWTRQVAIHPLVEMHF
jgi:hypothetical protein